MKRFVCVFSEFEDLPGGGGGAFNASRRLTLFGGGDDRDEPRVGLERVESLPDCATLRGSGKCPLKLVSDFQGSGDFYFNEKTSNLRKMN